MAIIQSTQSQFIRHSPKRIKKAGIVMKAMNNPGRQAILRFLIDNGGTPVNKLCEHLNLKQPITSQHLSLLRSCKLVTYERIKREVNYSINEERLEEVLAFVRLVA